MKISVLDELHLYIYIYIYIVYMLYNGVLGVSVLNDLHVHVHTLLCLVQCMCDSAQPAELP